MYKFWKSAASVFVLLSVAVITPDFAASEEPVTEPPALKCNIGPINKTFGEAEWVVYSCDDNRTVVVVSAAGNPASPFYFIFYPKDGGYKLGGEGTGDKKFTDAAFNELKLLSKQEIESLIEQTKSR